MGPDLAPRSSGLTALGRVHIDDAPGSEIEVRLAVAARVMQAGHGAIDIAVQAAGIFIEGGTLIWVVTTNKGWTHLRGMAADGDGHPDRQFRADLYSAVAVGDQGVDRFALRLYGADDDPNIASPTHKIHGWLASGSIRRTR